MALPSRNTALGFAARTRKNLEFVEAGFKRGEDVHWVTQLAISLLGLIVFPFAAALPARVADLRLEDLESQGWPHWEVSLGDCATLGELVYHLRNAVAHGHLRFSSDDRVLSAVAIEAEDFKPGTQAAYWRVRIRGDELRAFCFRFIDALEEPAA